MRLIHYSQKPLKRLYRTRQPTEPTGKPVGLWFSIEGPDDWLSWCRDEDYHLENLAHATELILHPRAEESLLHLKTPEDIDAFTIKYHRDTNPFSRLAINWIKVARAYPGIIIAPYQWERRLTISTTWYYAWDCASGCIWNTRIIEGLKPYPVAPPPTPEQQETDHARTQMD